MEQIKVKVLTSEEYARHKNPEEYKPKKFLEKQKIEIKEKVEKQVQYLEGIIELKYDENGNAIFEALTNKNYVDILVKNLIKLKKI